MSYAIRKDGQGWRAVNSIADVGDDEVYSEDQPAPIVPPPSIPSINARQIRMALTKLSLRAQVEAAVLAGDQDLKDWWDYSLTFERNHPEVAAMATALNVASAQVDTVWSLGATL